MLNNIFTLRHPRLLISFCYIAIAGHGKLITFVISSTGVLLFLLENSVSDWL